MSGVRRVLPMIAAVAVLLGVAGCGGSGDQTATVPKDLANQLLPMIDAIQTAQANGQCDEVKTRAQDFLTAVSQIKADDIDPDVKKKLVSASESLKSLAENDSDCAQVTTGPSGAQGATQPAEQATADPAQTTTSSDETTTPEVAAKPAKPGKEKKPAKAKPDPTAEPEVAKPAKPAKPEKASGKEKKPKKDKQPKKDKGTTTNSGGVTPGKGEG